MEVRCQHVVRRLSLAVVEVSEWCIKNTMCAVLSAKKDIDGAVKRVSKCR